jgi:haloacetate dehalogenase
MNRIDRRPATASTLDRRDVRGAAALVAGGAVRGARVTHSLALAHPDKVERACLLDIIPTPYLFSPVDKAFAESAYHWFFFARPAPFPETVISNSLELFVGRGAPTLGAEHRRVFRIPGTLHAA